MNLKIVPSRLISLVRGSRLVQSREEWDDAKETNERRLVFFYLCPIFPRRFFISASLLNIIEERSVTSHHHGSKISGSQKSFLEERDGHLHGRTMEGKYGLPFCS